MQRNTWILWLLLATPISTLSAQEIGAHDTPVTVAIDANAVAAAALAGEDYVLGVMGRALTLRLRVSHLRAHDFELRVNGLPGTSAPSSVILQGTVLEDPNASVRLSIRNDQLRGYIRLSDEWIVLEPTVGPRERHSHKAFDLFSLDPDHECACQEPIHAATLESEHAHIEPDPNAIPPVASGTGMLVMEVAIDVDFEFFQQFGTDTVAEVETILNEVDGIYQSEFNIALELVSVNVWNTPSDPYTTTDSSALLGQLRTYWNDNMQGIDRDVVHLFTHRDLDGSTVGVAYLGVVCQGNVAYGLTQRVGSLTHLVTAHEMGHNLGCPHDPVGTTPRFVMYPSLGSSNVEQFSSGSHAAADTYLSGVQCLALQTAPPINESPFLRGDANGNGSVDLVDVIRLFNFVFLGATAICPDALDINDDGTPDTEDGLLLMTFLYAAGAPPSAPFPSMGIDPTADLLGCSL